MRKAKQKKARKTAKPAAKGNTLQIDTEQLRQLLHSIDTSIDDCDSLISVVARALVQQDCDLDATCAHVIEFPAYSALEHAREYLKQAVMLLPSKEVAHE